MLRRKPDLIVPIRDRRQSRRILTLRNARNVAIVLLLLFVMITIHSEVRKPVPGQYGRLYSREMARDDAALKQPKVDVVREAPVSDQTAADPMLIAPAAREQWLGVDRGPQPFPQAAAKPTGSDDFVRPQPLLRREGGKVAIVGDANGVAVVQSSTVPEHKLQGGVFRP